MKGKQSVSSMGLILRIEHYDAIHGLIRIDDEYYLKIISILKDQWDRLEHIDSLGPIAKIFLSATHKKKEHHIGTYYLANEVVGLNQNEHKRLCVNCIIRGIGHLPYTYSTEAGVLLSCRISNELSSSLTSMLQPVIKMCKSRSSGCRKDCLEELLRTYNYKELYKWFSAYKILKAGLGKAIGEDVATIVNDLICRDNHINQMADMLGRIDYIQRDLRYSAIGEIKLPSYLILKDFSKPFKEKTEQLSLDSPELRLINDIRSYLDDVLYTDARVMALEGLFRRQIAKLILQKEISLLDLMSWCDSDLDTKISQLSIQNQGIIQLSTLREMDWSPILQATILAEDRWRQPIRAEPLETESTITGQPVNELAEYPQQQGFFVSVERRPNDTSRVSILSQKRNRHLRNIIYSAHRLLEFLTKVQGAFEEVDDFAVELLELILGCVDVRFDAQYVITAFQNWMQKCEKPRIDKLIKEIISSGVEENDPSILLMRRYFKRMPPVFPRYLVSDASLTPHLKIFSRSMIEDVQHSLERSEAIFKLDKDHALEVLAYLHMVWKHSQDVRIWARPLPTFIYSGIEEPISCDVVCLCLTEQRVSLHLIETTTQKSTKKATEDYMKIENKILPALRDKYDDLEIVPLQYSMAPMTKVFQNAEELFNI